MKFSIPGEVFLKRLSFDRISGVPAVMLSDLLKTAEAMQGEPMDELPLSLYKDFLRTGCRTGYETPYFRKRTRLSTLVIAELAEGKGRFLERIEDEIWSILGEPGWAIPPHNLYVRDTRPLPVPLTDRPVLDLFAMETGEILALSLNLLEGRLTPGLDVTARAELMRRIVDPYLSSWFWWMGWKGKEKLNNWTVWCTQNLLLTVFSLDLSQDVYHAAADKALASLADWYSQYGDDGCCDEGPHYWHAAGLCFFGAVKIVNDVSGGALRWLEKEPKYRAIASYITNMHVEGEWYLNFADSSPKAGELGVREYLFGKSAGDDRLVREALIDFRTHLDRLERGEPLPFDDNKYNLWYKWLKYRLAGEMASAPVPEDEGRKGYVYYPSVGISIYRNGSTVFAVKSGCNDDSHNHNDTGSVILYSGEHPVLVDIGVETYTAKTFSSERYTLPPMQSLYHNVVNFGGIGQCAGREFAASSVSSGPDGVSMELAGAYPPGTVGSYRRSVSFTAGAVSFTELVRGGKDPVLSLILLDKPEVEGEKLSAPSWSIVFRGAGEIAVEKMDITDSRLRIAWPDTLYRVLVPFAERLDWSVRI